MSALVTVFKQASMTMIYLLLLNPQTIALATDARCSTSSTIIYPVEDEHHVIFDCPEYTYVRKQFPDLFSSSVYSIGHFLNQPDCNRVAKFLTQVKAMRLNLA